MLQRYDHDWAIWYSVWYIIWLPFKKVTQANNFDYNFIAEVSFQPGTHPYSHKPFILLQPLHLSGHFLTQSSPQNDLGHPEEKTKCDKKCVCVCMCVLVCVMSVFLPFDKVFRHRIRLNRMDILNKETDIEKLPIILYRFVLCVFFHKKYEQVYN